MMTSPTTNQSRLGFALAAVLFLVSLLLPAYPGYSKNMAGWECAHAVAANLFGLWDNSFEFKRDFAEWVYYSAFNVTNLALLALPIMAFTKRFGRFSPLLPWLVGACFLHTASWWFQEAQSTQSGYYVWLLAVGVLFAACLARVRSQKQATETSH